MVLLAFIAACGGDSNQGRARRGTTTTASEATTTLATFPVFTTTTAARPRLVVTGAGISTAMQFSRRVATVGAVIRNESAQAAIDVTVTINIKDAAGTIVKSENTRLAVVPGNSEAYAAPGTFLDEGAPEPASAEAQVHAGGGADLDIGAFTFPNVTYRSDQYFGRVVGTITSGFAKTITQVHVNCVLFRGANVIGGGFTFVGVVPAGQSTGFETTSGLIPGLKVDSVRCSGTPSGLSAFS